MAPKRQSAFDLALIEAQTAATKNPTLNGSAQTNEVAPGGTSEASGEESGNTQAAEEISVAASPLLKDGTNSQTQAVKKTGRPKGITKTKKTFYLASGMRHLKAAQIDLVKQAGLLIKDESEVADLALALLDSMLKEEQGLEKVLTIYRELAKPVSRP